MIEVWVERRERRDGKSEKISECFVRGHTLESEAAYTVAAERRAADPEKLDKTVFVVVRRT